MNDLISRQAAIAYSISGMTREIDGAKWIRVSEVRGSLNTMPSAQPEIVRCEDCRYANECHKSVQYTRNEPNIITIGYSPIEWCSRGKRREKE